MQSGILMSNKSNKNTISHSYLYYRSVKYRYAHSMGVGEYRAVSSQHSIIFRSKHNTHTKNKSAYLKSPSRLYATGVANEEDEVYINPSYMYTWNTLMSRKESRGNRIDIKKGRVCLPSLIEFEPSAFTSLDPVELPIEHIKNEIDEVRKQLGDPARYVQEMRGYLKQLQYKITAYLNETTTRTKQQLSKLRELLQSNRVQQHELKLRWRNNCEELCQQDSDNRKHFYILSSRSNSLEDMLFSCLPFGLQRSEDSDPCQFPQYYF